MVLWRGRWSKGPSTLLDDGTPPAFLDHRKAQAAPTQLRAPLQQLGALPWWPRARASGRPQLELVFHAQPIGEDPTQEKAFRTAEVDEEKIARRHAAAASP